MIDPGIEKVCKILIRRERADLADQLQNSHSVVDESSTYGSYSYSTISSFDIFSPIEDYEKLVKISDDEQKTLLNAVMLVYPPKDNSPEIRSLRFFVDFDLEPMHHIDCKGLKELGFDYIKEQMQKCEVKIDNSDYDGAITNARTLVESVCLFILEENNVSSDCDGNLIKIYKEVNKVLKTDPSLYEEECFKQILSGMVSIINGLASLRNRMSDAHGRSNAKYYKPSVRHAILAMNSAKVISEFLYSSWKSKHS
ncbi:abortive infection family protein [Desulfosporosinus metallidurans]|uniref:Abortive phage resistance protein n=1 Tax=Desulfosporosinus metallidurans TaxID=1888891 RepID=A0A1Q8QNQ4_9FIRM|nr:abortive infection family protein [Desulfosporosinus metallidurans]OLN28967.1 Abortive phage resistance protein [Desulfosporosinus metallidurans]